MAAKPSPIPEPKVTITEPPPAKAQVIGALPSAFPPDALAQPRRRRAAARRAALDMTGVDAGCSSGWIEEDVAEAMQKAGWDAYKP